MILLEQALRVTYHLIALAVFLQSLEMIKLRTAWGAGGVWSWSVLKRDQTAPSWLDPLFEDLGFLILQSLLVVAALAAVFIYHPYLPPLLWVGAILTVWRWRGSFNGGSDSMTLLILLAVSLALLFPSKPVLQKACLFLIAVQVMLSYFVAGVVKVRERDWRSGRALTLLLTQTPYAVPARVQKWVENPRVAFAGAWLILLFELSFPLALLDIRLCWIYLGLGLVFHLMNVWILGLNRFFWAWLAGYPALVYLSLALN